VDPRVRDRLGRPPLERPPVAAAVVAGVDAALRLRPNWGWTAGLFGRRDRCLLVLSQLARIPHRHLADLAAGAITLTDGVVTISVAGRTETIKAVDDPVVCGPCAVARWLRTHQVIVTRIATRAVATHLDKVKAPTSSSPHACRRPFTLADRAVDVPLLATANQWGQAPFPPTGMSPHAVSRQARDLLEGIVTPHRTLPVDPPDPDAKAAEKAAQKAVARADARRRNRAASYTPKHWQAGVNRRRRDLAELAGVDDDLAAIDRRVADINQRVTDLLTLGTRPAARNATP
jgi:hypothetical protein